MDHTSLHRSNSVVDLECGGATFILEGDGDGLASSAPKFKKNLGRLRSGSLSFSGSIKSGNGLLLSEHTWSSGENLDILVDERDEGEAIGAKDEVVREKGKTRNSKKPPKPPLPPKRPSLGVADMKLIRELSELAQLRHARIERMKALKDKKAKKAPSSSSPIFAMVVTVLFLCVIIFQGDSGKLPQAHLSIIKDGSNYPLIYLLQMWRYLLIKSNLLQITQELPMRDGWTFHAVYLLKIRTASGPGNI